MHVFWLLLVLQRSANDYFLKSHRPRESAARFWLVVFDAVHIHFQVASFKIMVKDEVMSQGLVRAVENILNLPS